MLQLYADESGKIRSDNPAKGELAPVICSYIDTPENWIYFSREWKKILDDYAATCFHFREFANKEACKERKSPYWKWSANKRHKFLYDLAYLCSASPAIPGGTIYDVKSHLNRKSKEDPIEESIVNFFKSFQIDMDKYWPGYSDKVLFVFDKGPKKEWVWPITKVHSDFSARDPRIGGLLFEDDKVALPLQAADLLAFITRQTAKRHLNGEETPLRSLDFMLHRNLEPRLRQMNNGVWQCVVDWLREDEKVFMKQNPGKKYNPDKDFNLQKYVERERKRRIL
ncbi:MAG TPA: DUF3800 domain-containing protein [Verrucomicrobiae bacterium]|nr:DUF3800 domain-containing protein [Verrucomicrobiae bacterium]